MKRVRPAEEVDTEELLRQWSEKANIEYRQAKVLYAILVDTLVDGLCVQFRSVDLGFAVIHPRPYRANWHNYLIQRFQLLGQWTRARSREDRARIIRESGVGADMQDVYIMAVRNGLAYFSLEITPKKSWWRYMLSVQRRLLAAAGPVGYLRGLGRIVHKLKDRLLESHLAHRHEIALPCGRTHTGRYYGGNRYLVENRQPKKVTPSALPVRLGPMYQPIDPQELTSQHSGQDVEVEAKDLLPMPNIQPAIENMRNITPKQETQGGGD